MYIVSSTYFLRRLRNLDFFSLDLGKSKRIVGKEEYRKLDEFTLKYKNLFNKDILKFGNIANKIIFYEDVYLEQNKYIIFNNEDIYEISFTNEEIVDLKNYILEILRNISEQEENEQELSERNERKSKENTEVDGWVASDDKNGKKRYVINQQLSKEEYRKKMEETFFKKK